jgi:hypothetical protein
MRKFTKYVIAGHCDVQRAYMLGNKKPDAGSMAERDVVSLPPRSLLGQERAHPEVVIAYQAACPPGNER